MLLLGQIFRHIKVLATTKATASAAAYEFNLLS